MTIADTTHTSEGQLNHFPLSANLELFGIFDKGDDEGAFGPRHLVIFGWRVAGEIDVEALRGALGDVVERNEILRSEVFRTEVRKREQSYPKTYEIPNGVLFALDLLPSGEIAGHIKYNKVEFLETTMEKLTGDHHEILTWATTEPTIALDAL